MIRKQSGIERNRRRKLNGNTTNAPSPNKQPLKKARTTEKLTHDDPESKAPTVRTSKTLPRFRNKVQARAALKIKQTNSQIPKNSSNRFGFAPNGTVSISLKPMAALKNNHSNNEPKKKPTPTNS